MSRIPESENPGEWPTRVGGALPGFLGIAGFFLFSKHQAHPPGTLPFLQLVCCHAGHGVQSGPPATRDEQRS